MNQDYKSIFAEYFHQLAEESGIGFFLMEEGKFIYVNRYIADTLGYTEEELLHMNPKDIIYYRDFTFFLDIIKRWMNNEKVTIKKWLRVVKKDNTIVFCEAKAFPVVHKEKSVLMGTFLDVTASVLADQMLRENDLRYQRLIRYLPEPIVVHDGEKILYVNLAGLKLFGVSDREQLFSRPYMSLIHPDYREITRERFSRVYVSDDPLDFIENKLLGLDGRVIDVEVSSIRIHDFQGRPFVIQSVYRDLTQRKKEEEALIRSEKLSVVGQMAAGIAHEIRNPLTSLKGFTQFLKSKVNHNHEYFDIMLTELDRINTIVQEFMALAKPQAKQFAVHDLAKIFDSVTTLLEPQAIMNNVRMTTEFNSDVPSVYCDENQLKQVFINLMKNAIEAMPDGGELKVRLMRNTVDTVLIQIKDQGVGIPKEQLDLLGGPFYSTKSTGTGLGLMICFRIIEAHHGTIRFASEPGQGTTATVELPICLSL
jgi:two-component system sporulation sensor kinase A